MKTSLSIATALLLVIACSDPDTGSTSESDSDTSTADTVSGDAATEGTLTSKGGFVLTPVANGLDFPWDMLFLPSGEMLVSERGGSIRVVRDGVLDESPLSGTPEALVEGQGGYFGMALDPGFDSNRTLYLAYAKGTSSENTTAVIKGVLSKDAAELTDVQEIFAGTPRETSYHFGGRLAFLPDGTLIVTLGDGFRYMDEAQNPMNFHGAIARINTDGSVPEDNPYSDGNEGAPAVWSYGHRNTQGLVYDESRNILWAHEHGPKGGDELNRVEAGNNYGWPEITYGVNYDGTVITEETEAPGMEQPVVKWVPSIAPSGMVLVNSDQWPDWRGDLIVAAMNGPKGQKLVRIDLNEAGEALGTEDLLADLKIPFRDITLGPDGTLYVATANADGVIYSVNKPE